MPDFWPSHELICQFIDYGSVPTLQGITSKSVCSSVWNSLKFWASCSPFDSFPSDLLRLSKWISGKLFRRRCEGGDSLVSIVFIRRMSSLQDLLGFTMVSNTARYWVAQPSDLWGHRIRKRPCLPPLAVFRSCLIFLWRLNETILSAQKLLWPLLGTCSNTLWLLFIRTFFFLISSLNFPFLGWRLFVSHFLKLQVIPFPHWRLNFIPNG